MSSSTKGKSRHVYKTGAAGCGGKSAPVTPKNSGQPLPCPFCDKIFKQDGRLKEHIKNKHEGAAANDESTSGASAVNVLSNTLGEYVVKTPKNLLHEWCQKNKRPAPKFMHVQVDGGGFHCRVIVPDAKRTDADAIFWYNNAMPTAQEAHQRAAVRALHHVMGNRRMDRILPAEYRQQWYNLDIAAAEDEARMKVKLMKPKKIPQPARELQSVFMSEDNRKLVEEVLASNPREQESISSTELSEDLPGIRASLLRMGFKENDVESASGNAKDLASALDWLMLNVPESQLPAKFAPQASKAAVRVLQKVERSKLSEDVYSALVKCGYPDADCAAALQTAGGDSELALSLLFHELVDPIFSGVQGLGSEGDFASMRQDEMVALASIFSEGAIVSDQYLRFDVDLPADANAQLELEIRIPDGSTYPFETPIISFRSQELPSVCLRKMTVNLAECVRKLLGSPMIYDLVCYAAEASRLLLSGGLETPKMRSDVVSISTSQVQSLPRQRGALKIREFDVTKENIRLQEEWENLRNSASYASIYAARKKLPAYKKRHDVLVSVNSSPVTIICGETGCGKSTQVPQYILEQSIERGEGGNCSVICTQPRRISAIGLADRVAKERSEVVGRMVGYSVRLESRTSLHTRLLYCTTGILLRRLFSDPDLCGITHVIVDEVHERTMESDLLLMLLKRHLKRTGGSVRVILMSATLEASMFAEYFKRDLDCSPPSILQIPGFTFPVRELFLEDVLELTGYKVARQSRFALKKSGKKNEEKQEEHSPSLVLQNSGDVDSWESHDDGEYPEKDSVAVEYEYSAATEKTMGIVDEAVINFELIEVLLSSVFRLEAASSPIYGPLVEKIDDGSVAGAVLVFLPGIQEIRKLQVWLQSSRLLTGYGIEKNWVLALHGSLSSEEQRRVFLRPPNGVRKIVLATNVAETSITIDDIRYVIDTGRHKEMSYDHVKGLSCLKETWISKANAKQRSGRAGRVQAGCCLRLFSRKLFQSFDSHQLPEILRVSLEGLCLRIKSLVPCEIRSAFMELPTPPNAGAVVAAVERLKELNAVDEDENLTPLGQHIARMPLDARLGKMLIFATMLRCLDPILTIAAAMSGRPLFLSPIDKRDEAMAAKQRFAGNSKSDHIALVAAYNGWLQAKEERVESNYCSVNFLSKDALSAIQASRREYLNILKELGFVGDDDDVASNDVAFSVRVVKAVICAGLYPNVARVRHPERRYAETEGGAVAKVGGANEVQLYMRSEGRVFMHPSSVNFEVKVFERPWIVVSEKVKSEFSGKVMVRECSMVSGYSLLLFGGKIEVRHERQMIAVDEWIEFEVPARIAVLIKELRAKVDLLLLDKIKQPLAYIYDAPVVSALVTLLQTDGF